MISDSTPIFWIAAKKLGAEGRSLFCKNISEKMNIKSFHQFDDSKVEGGIIRFLHQRRNELLIDVLICRSKLRNESSSSEIETARSSFYVTRGKHAKCVSHLKQFVPSLKIFAVNKQICDVMMPSKSQKNIKHSVRN